MFSDHFLDANILVGSRISWDRQYNGTTRYMALEGIRRHTSKRVYYESRGVFERSRGLILKYLKRFYEEFNRSRDPMRLDQIIRAFTRKFSGSLGEKESKILNSFVERNFMEIRNTALGGEREFGDFRRAIIDAFMGAINSIDRDCYSDPKAVICRYDDCPPDYRNCYAAENNRLLKVINYESDVLVALDSYFIRNKYIKNNVCFVTTDHEHMLKKKAEIESILTGIFIMQPR
jgi:hypothetical protein